MRGEDNQENYNNIENYLLGRGLREARNRKKRRTLSQKDTFRVQYQVGGLSL